MTLIEKYLKTVTNKSFKEWIIRDSFKCFTSASNDRCLVQLGSMGNGMLVVCEHIDSGMNTYYFKNRHKAIEKYSELLKTN